MDLQAIGIIAASRTTKNGFDPANEEQYYQERSGVKRIGMLVELVGSGHSVLISIFALLNPKRPPELKRWESISE